MLNLNIEIYCSYLSLLEHWSVFSLKLTNLWTTFHMIIGFRDEKAY